MFGTARRSKGDGARVEEFIAKEQMVALISHQKICEINRLLPIDLRQWVNRLSRQWAYKGRPVYLRFHDSVEAPGGNGLDGVWHYLEP